jgi:hypothetical protein
MYLRVNTKIIGYIKHKAMCKNIPTKADAVGMNNVYLINFRIADNIYFSRTLPPLGIFPSRMP